MDKKYFIVTGVILLLIIPLLNANAQDSPNRAIFAQELISSTNSQYTYAKNNNSFQQAVEEYNEGVYYLQAGNETQADESFSNSVRQIRIMIKDNKKSQANELQAQLDNLFEQAREENAHLILPTQFNELKAGYDGYDDQYYTADSNVSELDSRLGDCEAIPEFDTAMNDYEQIIDGMGSLIAEINQMREQAVQKYQSALEIFNRAHSQLNLVLENDIAAVHFSDATDTLNSAYNTASDDLDNFRLDNVYSRCNQIITYCEEFLQIIEEYAENAQQARIIIDNQLADKIEIYQRYN